MKLLSKKKRQELWRRPLPLGPLPHPPGPSSAKHCKRALGAVFKWYSQTRPISPELRKSSTAARFYSHGQLPERADECEVGWSTDCKIGSPIASTCCITPQSVVHRKQHWFSESNQTLQKTTDLSWPLLRTTARSIRRPRSPAEPHPPSLARVQPGPSGVRGLRQSLILLH